MAVQTFSGMNIANEIMELHNSILVDTVGRWNQYISYTFADLRILEQIIEEEVKELSSLEVEKGKWILRQLLEAEKLQEVIPITDTAVLAMVSTMRERYSDWLNEETN